MPPKDKLILLGVISSAHGIKGDVILKSFTEPENNIFTLPLVDSAEKSIKIKFVRKHPKSGLVCKISGCDDRTQAESLLKTNLYCLRENLPKLTDEDEFYFEDLHNMQVVNNQQELIGVITNVANYGAGDIVEITFLLNKKSAFFPFTKELFPEITKEYVKFTGQILED